LYTLPPPIQNNTIKKTNKWFAFIQKDLDQSKSFQDVEKIIYWILHEFLETWLYLFKKGYNAHLLLLIEVPALQVMGNLPAKSPHIPPIWCKPGKLYGKRNPTRTKKSLTGKRKKEGAGGRMSPSKTTNSSKQHEIAQMCNWAEVKWKQVLPLQLNSVYKVWSLHLL
jgi:hypothetical protein